MNYQEANELLTGRCKSSRKLEKNTYLQRREGGKIAVLYHETDIITFQESGRTVLTSGGWKTATTKDRLNKYFEVGVFQDKGQWYVGNWNVKKPWPIFFDGMAIKNGTVIRPKFQDKTFDKLQKQIKAYCKGIAELNVLPVPDAGDCWFCHMQTKDGESLGDATNNTGHLKAHLKEKYIHGSLIFNALKNAGYQDGLIAMVFDQEKRERSLNYRDCAVRAVRRYFKRKLGLPV